MSCSRHIGRAAPAYALAGITPSQARAAAARDLRASAVPAQLRFSSAAPLVPTPPQVDALCAALRTAGGEPLLVGGCVRDSLRRLFQDEPYGIPIPVSDFDIEVRGLDPETLRRVASAFGRVDEVGLIFAVIQITLEDGSEIDVSLPRTDSKVAEGGRGRGIAAEGNPFLDRRTAAARRDVTANSLAYDPCTHRLYDYFGGVEDIRNGVLRHTSDAFADDPLRALRLMKFVARLGYQIHPSTQALCRSIASRAGTLSPSRFWHEWCDLASGAYPGLGLMALRDMGWLHTAPELQELDELPQDLEYHPEGDAFVHTCYVADEIARIAIRAGLVPQGKDVAADARTRARRAALVLGAICHDLGKATTTEVEIRAPGGTIAMDGREWRARARGHDCPGEVGRVTSRRHASAGAAAAEALMNRIGVPQDIQAHALPLVREHMAHLSILSNPPANWPGAMRRLSKRLAPATIEDWGFMVEADHSGRPPLQKANPAQPLVETARRCAVSETPFRATLHGRHLIEMGIPPGRHMGAILQAAEAAEMDGQFKGLDDAREWTRGWLAAQGGWHALVHAPVSRKVAQYPAA